MRSYLRRPRAAASGFNARDVARAYGCPVDQADGTGVTIGVIELGGAYNSGDLARMGLDSGKVTAWSAGGGRQKSDGPDGADGEVMLDVEVIAQVAPGASIRVYFCPNSDPGYLAAVTKAVVECDVVSTSWGDAESTWNRASIQKMAPVFAAAKARLVPVFAAAGDAGSKDGTRADAVDYPASDPSVVGCGGTRLTLDSAGRRKTETVWNDNSTSSATGGGVSAVFASRMVPDVAGNADPQTGYGVTVDGQQDVIGGTSAVAPLYAACYAICRQVLGRAFDFQAAVMANPTVCVDVVSGNNGTYRAGPGRDEVSGWGVVDFGRLLTALSGTATTPVPVPTPTPAPTPVPTPGPVQDPTVLLHTIQDQIAAFFSGKPAARSWPQRLVAWLSGH